MSSRLVSLHHRKIDPSTSVPASAEYGSLLKNIYRTVGCAKGYAAPIHKDNNFNEYMITYTAESTDAAKGGNFFLCKYRIKVEAAANARVAWKTADWHDTSLIEDEMGENYGLGFLISKQLPSAWKNYLEKQRGEDTEEEGAGKESEEADEDEGEAEDEGEYDDNDEDGDSVEDEGEDGTEEEHASEQEGGQSEMPDRAPNTEEGTNRKRAREDTDGADGDETDQSAAKQPKMAKEETDEGHQARDEGPDEQ